MSQNDGLPSTIKKKEEENPQSRFQPWIKTTPGGLLGRKIIRKEMVWKRGRKLIHLMAFAEV